MRKWHKVYRPADRFFLFLTLWVWAASSDDFLTGLILQMATVGNASCCWCSTLNLTLIGYEKYFFVSSTTLYSNAAVIPIITTSQKSFLNPPVDKTLLTSLLDTIELGLYNVQYRDYVRHYFDQKLDNYYPLYSKISTGIRDRETNWLLDSLRPLAR